MMDKILINGLTPKGKIFLQIFLRFLKENDYFYNYKKYFKGYKAVSKFERLILCCNNFSPRVVDKTLHWTETDEGFDYWAYVHCQFQTLWSLIQINNTSPWWKKFQLKS